jgi:hypothetical protein
MKLQVLKDSQGKPTGVFINVKDWEKLKKKHVILRKLEDVEPDKESLLKEIKQSVKELKLIEQGKLKSRPVKNLLDEL